MKKTRNATSINADGAGTHLPVYRARTKQVKKIADTLNLNLIFQEIVPFSSSRRTLTL